MISGYTKHLFKLSQVFRFAGKRLNHRASVAEHSFRVAGLAMSIVDQYNKDHALENRRISVEEVLRKAILHDLEESITGDIPSPVKEIGNLRSELRFAGKTLLKKHVFLDTPCPEDYLDTWEKDKSEESGEIIEIADKLEGLICSYFEVEGGNVDLHKPLMSHFKWFKSDRGRELLEKYSYARKEFLMIARTFVLKVKNSKLDNAPRNLGAHREISL